MGEVGEKEEVCFVGEYMVFSVLFMMKLFKKWDLLGYNSPMINA